MDDSLVNLGQYKAGCEQRLFQKKKKKKGQIRLCYDNLVLLNQRLYVCFVISLSICFWLFKCGVFHVTCCVCVCVCVRGTGSHHIGVCRPSEIILTAACVLQIHTSIITVSVTWLFSFWAWTDGKTNLKALACDYGKGCYISDMCLRCSANHNVLGQLANQSRQC